MAFISQPVSLDSGAVGLYINTPLSAGETTVADKITPLAVGEGTTVQAISPWSTVYVPFTVKEGVSTVPARSLHAVFGEPRQTTAPPENLYIFIDNGNKTAVVENNATITISKGSTLFAPYVPETIGFDWLKNQLNVAIEKYSPTSTATNSAQSLASNQPSGISNEATGTGSGTSNESRSNTSTAFEENDSQTVSPGALAGGVIGGFAAGLMICFLAWFCYYRRFRAKSPRASTNLTAASRTPHHPMEPTFTQEKQVFEVPKGVVGWQKHLPQEKDDAAIVRAVKTLYDQIQIHIEGFYRDKKGKPTHQDIAVLERFCSDSFSESLWGLPNGVPLLEAILVRWIVQRISLRSSTRQSFLPSEYTEIPKQNGWHMEMGAGEQGQVAESKKGFSQAFTQWRMLTGFLILSAAENPEYQKQRDTKTDYAARLLSEAFAPWSLDGKNVTDHDASLRGILLMASDVGLLFFAQPSTFAFDWSSKEGSVTIYPALIKRLDESARPLRSPQVMVGARHLAV